MPNILSLEVVVLGKGVGESVLVRVEDDWTIIDSFQTAWPGINGTVPAPLAYLRQQGVNPATAVRAVILSHLHADHCRGIDEVVRACEDAKFYLPAAIPDAAWREMLKLEIPGEDRRALAEVASVYRFATDDDRFLTAASVQIIHQPNDVVRAIGPSQRAVQAAREPLAEGDPVGARRVLNENYTSIVVLIVAGAAIALLGADMDAREELGWPRLLIEHHGRAWVGGVGLVKVPHHGSRTAFHPEMYLQWTSRAVGVIAPNGSRLPKDDMIAPLKEHLPQLYLAGPERRQPLGETDAHAPSETFLVRATHDGAPGSVWQVEPPQRQHQVL